MTFISLCIKHRKATTVIHSAKIQENNSEVFTYSTEHINNSLKYWLWRPKPEQQMAQSEEKLYLWTSHNFLYSVLHITGTYVPLHQRSQTYGW